MKIQPAILKSAGVLCFVLTQLAEVKPVFAGTNEVRINERFPITNRNELSPPLVLQPIHECAQAVGVSGFIPHATVKIFSGGNQLMGQLNDAQIIPFGQYAVVPLTRTLNLNEKITATQTVGNLTSVESYVPVIVEAYDTTTLPMPLVSKEIYECGRIVPVSQLIPSAYVTVFDSGNPIGKDEPVGTSDPVFTSPLKVNHLITAQQVACPADASLKITGPLSTPGVKVLPSPNPPPSPTVDAPVIGNDSVTLHNLYVGAEVQILNHGAVIGGGFATGKDNWCSVNPPIGPNPSIQATQKLCSESKPSRPQTNTVALNALTILPPVCTHSEQVTIRGSQIDATVVVRRNGSQIVGYGGAVAGDLVLPLGGGLHLAAGDVLTAYQYAGTDLSPVSASLVVGECSDVVTYHNDDARTGLNPNEKILTPANVKVSSFGLLFSHAVDGEVYGQPLCLSQITIPNQGVHNVVFAVTEHDSVYAFDADSDSGVNASPLWHVNFLSSPDVATIPSPGDVGCDDIHPEIGTTSTPVIDRASMTIYVVSKTKEMTGGHAHFVQRLHALNVGTGAEKFGGPIVIADTISDNPGANQFEYVSGPTVPGSGESNEGDNEVFYNALRQAQRSGLALVNGIVYLASGSHCDTTPYHGWLLGFNATTLQLVSVLNTTPNATTISGGLAAGGIWEAGDAPAADSQGALYVATGNGIFDGSLQANGFPSQGDLGDSILKVVLDPGSSPNQPNQNGWALKVADFFTPSNQVSLWGSDSDLGSGGILLLPDQSTKIAHLLVQTGKEGTLYLVNRDNLGKFHAGSDKIVQEIPNAVGGVWSTPAFFNNTVYYNGSGDVLKAFRLANGLLSTTPVAKAGTQFGFPGATPSISGGRDTAIVWTLQTDQFGKGPTILHAYRADNLTELYNSSTAARNRDQPPGNAVKFTLPTVVNGKVFIGTSKSLAVYGNLF